MLQLLHTPEGVRDYYGDEFARRLALSQKIREVFSLYGFQEIMTPVFEYFDIFNAERGSVASRYMYKLFDRDGETLVLRPDFTPAIARCASKYFGQGTLPIRLCYIGNTYVNTVGYRGQLKETLQAGAELVGDPTVEANAEMLAMIIDLFRKVGLKDFQLEVGDVRYFGGLLAEAKINDEIRQELRSCIANKNHFGLEELLTEYRIADDLSRVLLRLPHMFGAPEDILAEADALTYNPTARKATRRLRALYECMKQYGMERYITFDLGMLGAQDYYTGVIFKGYTYGTGDHIVTGGRYDNLLEQFGKSAPSIGFGISVDTLLQAMTRQNIPIGSRQGTILIRYAPSRFQEAAQMASHFREEGSPVQMLSMVHQDMRGLQEYIHENHIIRILELKEGTDTVDITGR